MKNNNLIIKIAVAVAAVATLFSVVTLIRNISVRMSIVFPIIQVAGSAAILTVCVVMLISLSRKGDGEEPDEEKSEPDQTDENSAVAAEQEDAERAIDELYEKYHLSEFDDKAAEDETEEKEEAEEEPEATEVEEKA